MINYAEYQDKNPFIENLGQRSMNSTSHSIAKFENSRGTINKPNYHHSRVNSNYQDPVYEPKNCQKCDTIKSEKFNLEEKFKFMKSQNFEF